MVDTKFLIGSTLDCLLVSDDPEELLDMIQCEIDEKTATNDKEN